MAARIASSKPGASYAKWIRPVGRGVVNTLAISSVV